MFFEAPGSPCARRCEGVGWLFCDRDDNLSRMQKGASCHLHSTRLWHDDGDEALCYQKHTTFCGECEEHYSAECNDPHICGDKPIS